MHTKYLFKTDMPEWKKKSIGNILFTHDNTIHSKPNISTPTMNTRTEQAQRKVKLKIND